MKHFSTPWLKATSLPSAVIFSIVAALVAYLMIMSLLCAENLLGRIERMEQIEAVLHAACVKYDGDAMGMGIPVFATPIPATGVDVEETEVMHGLYGRLDLSTGLWGKAKIKRSFITGSCNLPEGDAGLVIPDNGVTVTLGGGCAFSSPLCLPSGYFRIYNTGNRPYDSLSVRPSAPQMPDLSAGALELLDTHWEDVPAEVLLTSSFQGRDSLVRGLRVVVDSTFRGCVQVFARDSAVVLEGACMDYPSGVCLISDNDGAGIRIEKNAVVEGYAVVLNAGGYRQDRGSVVRGLVYAPGLSVVSGSVTGAAYLGKPVDFTIMNLVQNRNTVFAYPLLFSEGRESKVIRRL